MNFTLFGLSLFEISLLLVCTIILACTIYFYYTTRKSLRRTLEAYGVPPKQKRTRKTFRRLFARNMPAPVAAGVLKKAEITWPEPLAASGPSFANASIAELQETLRLQQQTLSGLMQRVEDLQGNNAGARAIEEENETLQIRIEELELALMRKDQELKQVRQQEAIAQQMAARIDEVYKEFDLLQHKISTLEAQAAKATALQLELEAAQQAYQQLQKDMVRKQLRLDELTTENTRLRAELGITAGKAADAATQQQHQLKRNKALKDAHQTDLHELSENSNKLQKELRRIGELESMLSLMAEERARLLDKHKK